MKRILWAGVCLVLIAFAAMGWRLVTISYFSGETQSNAKSSSRTTSMTLGNLSDWSGAATKLSILAEGNDPFGTNIVEMLRTTLLDQGTFKTVELVRSLPESIDGAVLIVNITPDKGHWTPRRGEQQLTIQGAYFEGVTMAPTQLQKQIKYDETVANVGSPQLFSQNGPQLPPLSNTNCHVFCQQGSLTVSVSVSAQGLMNRAGFQQQVAKAAIPKLSAEIQTLHQSALPNGLKPKVMEEKVVELAKEKLGSTGIGYNFEAGPQSCKGGILSIEAYAPHPIPTTLFWYSAASGTLTDQVTVDDMQKTLVSGGYTPEGIHVDPRLEEGVGVFEITTENGASRWVLRLDFSDCSLRTGTLSPNYGTIPKQDIRF